MRDIAEIVGDAFPGCSVSFGQDGGDNRSYKVRFDKIHAQLPGFSCDWDATSGAKQLADVFTAIDLDGPTFTGRGHTRLKQLEHLIRTNQVDGRLFWTRA